MSDLKKQLTPINSGYKEILKIALPLIVSSGAFAIQLFVDRVFLMNYNPETMTAAFQAGILSWTVTCFFFATISYTNTFVAQFKGNDQNENIGKAVWQGIILSIISGVFLLALGTGAKHIFALLKHSEQLQIYEVQYFRLLLISSTPAMIKAAISAFYTGRGKTSLIMVNTLLSTTTNIILNWVLIFGHLGFQEMGIKGAAIATIISQIQGMLILFLCFISKKNREKYGTNYGFKIDFSLLKRMLRYGMPSGLEFFLEMICWSLFVAASFWDTLNPNAPIANTITCQINQLSFIPMMGFEMAVSSLVGRHLGSNRPANAQRVTLLTLAMTMGYMAILAIGYITIPDIFISPFTIGKTPEEIALFANVARTLLIFAAVHALSNSGYMIFAAALKGAGDTKFVMVICTVFSWVIIGTPCIYYYIKGTSNIYILWGFAAAFKFSVAIVFAIRFFQGKWKNMRVIEMQPMTPIGQVPEEPEPIG